MDNREEVWVPDTRWIRLNYPKRCRFFGGVPRRYCGKAAYWAFPRSNGPWAYCPEHMYGAKLMEIPMIKVYAFSPAAKRGCI